jgi:hypothetical protein
LKESLSPPEKGLLETARVRAGEVPPPWALRLLRRTGTGGRPDVVGLKQLVLAMALRKRYIKQGRQKLCNGTWHVINKKSICTVGRFTKNNILV